MSDTPRTDEQINGKPCTRFAILAGDSLRNASVPSEFCRQLERELSAANERVRLLIAERDTARRQADQKHNLREEFTDLIGTDDVEHGVAVVRDMKERISKLHNYVSELETAGDEMAKELSYGYDVDMWNKAKEAKP